MDFEGETAGLRDKGRRPCLGFQEKTGDIVQAETDRTDTLTRLFESVERVPRLILVLCSVVGTALISLVDGLVTPLLALSVFYLLPVLAAASRSVRLGMGSALFTAVSWCSVDLLKHGSVYTSPLVPVANAVSRLLVLTVLVLLVEALRRDRQREAQMARVDQLTALANARSFYDAVERARLSQSRTGRPVTIAYLDLDNFKSINDALGHSAGDLVLRHAGTVLATSVRTIDTAARLGGDEFAVLMPETGQEEATAALARLHDLLTRRPAAAPGSDSRHVASQTPSPVQVSIGAVTFLRPLVDVDSMIREADNAMYQAKRSGKNHVVVATHAAGIAR